MSFRVHTPSGTDEYSDADRYDYLHPGWGSLVVIRADDTKVLYGPAGWTRMEEAPPAGSRGERGTRTARKST